jgi:hypothetical protein
MDAECRVGSPGLWDVLCCGWQDHPYVRNILRKRFLLTEAIQGQSFRKRLLVCVAFIAVFERSFELNWQKN